MKSFPMFLRTTGRRVVIAGGGEQAAQKARLVLKTDADIVLAAPELDSELRGIVAQGRAVHQSGNIPPALFRDRARVRDLTEHFDGLVREADVSARDWPAHLQALSALSP